MKEPDNQEKRPRRPYKRAPFSEKKTSVDRMAPVLEYFKKAGMPISEIAAKCGVTRQFLNYRINTDDCPLSLMEKMADAAGYEFVWSWKKKRGGKAAKEEAPAAE